MTTKTKIIKVRSYSKVTPIDVDEELNKIKQDARRPGIDKSAHFGGFNEYDTHNLWNQIANGYVPKKKSIINWDNLFYCLACSVLSGLIVYTFLS